MEGGSIYQFCGNTSFWNESYFANSSWPRMTPCFLNTALVWIPCGWLWVTFPFYVFFLYSNDKRLEKIPVSVLNVMKLLICTFLCLLNIVYTTQLIAKRGDEEMETIVVLNSALYLVTFFLAGILTLIERVKGCVTSLIQFVFWLALLFANIIPFYSKIYLKTYSEDSFDFVSFYIFYLFVFVQFILHCLAEKRDPSSATKEEENICPEMYGSILNKVYFWWMNGIVMKAYKKPLEEKDVWNLGLADKSKTIVPLLEKNWNKELSKAERKVKKSTERKVRKHADLTENEGTNEKTPLLSSDFTLSPIKNDGEIRYNTDEIDKKKFKPSLSIALVKTFGPVYLTSLFVKLLSDILQLLGPVLMGFLINYADAKPALPAWRGYVPAILLFLATIFQSVFYHQSFQIGMTVGMRIKSTLTAAILKKSLSLSAKAKKSTQLGEIVNLMSVDCQRIQDTFTYCWALMTSPVQTLIGISILWDVLGPSCLAGFLVLLILAPMNSIVIVLSTRFQQQILLWKGKRIKMVNEILNGMKVLKMYAWESSFKAKVKELRDKELHYFRLIAYMQGAVAFGWILAPYLMGLATFASFVTLSEDHWLDPYKAFVTLSVFNILRTPTNLLTMSLSLVTQAFVSIRRIEKFLVLQDLEPNNVQRTLHSDYAVEIKEGLFTWDSNMPYATLRDINLKVNEGQLVAVVGQVGCGKSSLISALLGEMVKLGGRVTIKGSVAYVPQEAWIQNATLKDNILFGKGFLRKKYNKVVEACALAPDLEILPGGDMIEIGEKGINISGGQKQRISLARAVYNNSDIYLMDDPLSAVDSHVGKHIFEKVIGPKGLLKNKTRLLVTHGVHWLPMVDTVVVMVNGKLSEIGSYEELVSHDGAFAQFLKQYFMQEEESDTEDPEIQHIKQKMIERMESVTSEGLSTTDTEGHFPLTKQYMHRKRMSSQTIEIQKPEKSLQVEKLTTDEFSSQAEIKFSVFGEYAKSAGIWATVSVIILLAVYQSFNILSNFWLNFWTEDEYLSRNRENSTSEEYINRSYRYLTMYGMFGIIQAVFVMCYAFLLWIRTVVASRKLHHRMLERVLRAPMAFFDTTPIGRITNRFSSDIDIMDNVLPQNFRIMLGTVYSTLSTLLVVSINTPAFLILLIPVIIIYYFLMKFYVPTAWQLKRLEAVTRSPVYNHFSETVTGASVIRAFGATDRFIDESMRRVDKHLVHYYANFSSARWLGVRLEIFANILVFAVSMFSLFSGLDGGSVGLTITYALQATLILNQLVVNISDLSNNIVSVERIKEYCEVGIEAEWYSKKRPPINWPTTGNIQYANYQTRYREGLDLVLRGINLEIKHGEMIGIVGRTGAGKSSLTLSLFRLIEAASGAITIDGVKISTIGLHDLRSKVNILPQDPVLFSGSLRMNLDPFDQYTDDEIWQALESAHLKEFVLTTPTQLDYQCGESGSNLSVGQRQLVCLARTVLKKTKILILDEATAAVDFQTDDLIQQTIRREFRDCTVLTIAHRLNTILDYDRVMVLDDGKIIEFDTPENLLENKDTVFYGMAKDAGLTNGQINRSLEMPSGLDTKSENPSVNTRMSTNLDPCSFQKQDFPADNYNTNNQIGFDIRSKSTASIISMMSTDSGSSVVDKEKVNCSTFSSDTSL